MTKEENIKYVLKQEIAAGKKKFVVLPYGKWGKFAKRELEECYNIEVEACLDSADVEGATKLCEVDWEKTEGYFLLITVRQRVRKELREELLRHVPESRIIDVFDYIEVKSTDVKLDFLCVGFQKCGTTSLDFALKENEYVYTPPEKETLYLKWYKQYTNSAEMFAESYPKEKLKGKAAVGGIEPSYYVNARDVYRCFGSDIKIIFVVRNPVKATYSNFKMFVREANTDNILDIFKRFNRVSPEMFDVWVQEFEDDYRQFRYMDYLEEFMEYYPVEHIKVVLFEELIKDTQRVMDEVQEFIGLDKMQRKIYTEIPHENVGNLVCQNYACALINNAINKLVYEVREDGVDLMEEIKCKKTEMGIVTRVEYTEPMLPETEAKLRAYFADSVMRLEKFLNRKTNW